LTRAEVEAQLKGTEASIDRHVEVLEQEFKTLGDYVRERLLRHPLLGLGGALLGGLVVGWIFGGRGRGPSKRRAAEAALQVLVDRYLRAVVDDAAAAIRDGAPPEAAVRAALLERMPVVPVPVTEPSDDDRSSGVLALLGATLLKITMSEALSYLTSNVLPRAIQSLVPGANAGRAGGEGSPDASAPAEGA
ncbi:MAG: hypothetical protein D6685_10515, partial [Bacteroidetes bacterium]